MSNVSMWNGHMGSLFAVIRGTTSDVTSKVEDHVKI